MKRIIEIPDKVVEAIQNGEDYRYDIHTAIAQSKPYDDSGDCISRSALREALKELHTRAFEIEDEFFEFGLLIDNAPSVTPKQGEWINREAVSNTIFPFWERCECNQCHKFNGYSNFCPNCGAKMQGGAK